ncbi:MAG: hypothetical protein CM15mV19_0910 [uncultured marine virus]|nr:MAG: hypothetical protein CM15mV19_0910 [uncultured marine virus]
MSSYVAKQARDLFTLTQGTNWDTTTFNDPYLVFKKQVQLSNAIALSERETYMQ